MVVVVVVVGMAKKAPPIYTHQPAPVRPVWRDCVAVAGILTWRISPRFPPTKKPPPKQGLPTNPFGR